jgi:hypothetical protein
MRTYLSRPVFDFELSWSRDISTSIAYDRREIRTPFGPVVFRPSQRYEAHGWDIDWMLAGSDAIALEDAFEDTVKGQLTGFWFPAPQQLCWVADQTAYAWSSPADDNKILVEAADFAALLAAVPELHVTFTNGDATPIDAKVTAVAAGPAGYEILTLSIARPSIDRDWMMLRLLYVHLVTDEIERTVLRPDLLSLTARVVELPTEYATLETTLLKVWFYRFFYGGPGTAPDLAVDWFYTNVAVDVATTYGGTIASTSHTSIPITHGDIKFTAKTLGSTCRISAPLVTGSPFSRLVPTMSGEQLWVEIRAADYATPNSTTLVFTGELEKAPTDGPRLSLTFSNGRGFKRKGPLLLRQSWCGYRFGDPVTCKATVPSVAVTVTIVSGRVVTVSGSLTTTSEFYAGGFLDAGTGREREVIAVRQSVDAGGGNVLLTLARAPSYAASTTGTLKRGCRKTTTDCLAFQGDLDNYGGLPFIPQSNPTITPLEHAPGGNKK